MTWQTLTGRRGGILAATACLAVLAIGVGSHLAAQDAAPASAESPAADGPRGAAKPRKHRIVHKAPAKPAETSAETRSAAVTPPPPPAATPVAVTAPAKAPDPVDYAAQLDKAGASTCHGQVNALAASTMGSVRQFNTMSNWSAVGGEKRAVSLAIGQKYADGSAVPFSVAQVISTPNQQGNCDGFTVQVFPSPLPCGKLRETLVVHGKQIGDLAGVALIQDAAGRTMLVPTAANTCVLVATRAVYTK